MSHLPLLPALFGRRIRDAEEQDGRAFEAVIGIVVDNKDPDKLGRVKVNYPSLPGDDTSYWAPIASLGAGEDRGWWFLPDIDDEVLIVFEHGEFNRPVVVGALWNGKDKPADANDGANERRTLVSKKGSMVCFDDDAGVFTIESGGSKVTIEDGKIRFETDGDIALSAPDGDLEIVAKDLEFKGKMGVTIAAGKALKVAAGKIEVKAGKVTASGGTLDINPGSAAAPAEASASPEEEADPA